MARIAYSGVPDESAEAAPPEDYQHLDVQPAAFGGEVAQGIQKLGAGLMDRQHFYDQVAADNSTNNTMDQVTKALYGDPGKMVPGPDGKPAPDTGYFGLRGAAAMQARGDIQQHIDDVIRENRESLSTPRAQEQYDVDTRRFRAGWLGEMGRHADEQQKVWAADTNKTAASLAINSAARDPTNDIAAQQSQEAVRTAYVRNAQLAGEDPHGAVLKADQDVLQARLRSLIVTNPSAAQKLFADKGNILASLPNYDETARAIKGQVVESGIGPLVDSNMNAALSQASGAVRSGTTGTAGTPGISAALGAQEWSGTGPAPPSIDGALGPSQIKPDTARQYGLDPTRLNDHAYAKTARDTIVAKLSALPNVQGDPDRIAVGYFSGAGNIAPIGSPTPWITDKPDGNGKYVSSYVADIKKRLGATPTAQAQGQNLSVADNLRLNETAILDKTRADAQAQFGNQYPDAVERTVTAMQRRIEQTISQQDQQYIVASHIVQKAMTGPHPPTSEKELNALGPQVAQAWQTMQFNDPWKSAAVERMFDANAKGQSAGYGTNFGAMLDRVLAPVNDASRVRDPSQLWNYVTGGEDGPLTNTGAGALSTLMQMRGTPQGEADSTTLRNFLREAHSLLSRQDPSLGFYDPKGEAAYTKFIMGALPLIQAERQQGKPLSSILAPKGDVYNAIFAFKRKPGQEMLERIQDPNNPAVQAASATPDDISRQQQDLKSRYFAAKSQSERDAMIKEGVARGWIAAPEPPKPDVPLPQ